LVNRQIDKAIAKLEEAVKTDPGNGDALLFLGYAYQENHQREKAIAAFEQAIKVDPEQDDARAQLKELRGSTPETENPAK
jgi:cytochrome c-type biogenesis protein CcmH/NrfG